MEEQFLKDGDVVFLKDRNKLACVTHVDKSNSYAIYVHMILEDGSVCNGLFATRQKDNHTNMVQKLTSMESIVEAVRYVLSSNGKDIMKNL